MVVRQISGPSFRISRFARLARLAKAFAVAAVVLACSACGGSPTYNWAAERAAGYKVGAGDVVKVNVWKHDELSQQVTVRPDGAFSMPLLGDIIATGRSVNEITTDMQS